VATVAFFHAHPDDEAIATGGTMAKLADAGHRTICITATRGELGEVDEGVLRPGEQLWERRVAEQEDAWRVLGVARGEFLGYRDSGMAGEPTNDDADCFWQADIDDAGGRLAALLRDESVDVLTVYDSHGGYGHPDHIQVHRVGVRAAELAGTPRVYESTFDRDYMRQIMTEARAAGVTEIEDAAEALDDEQLFGVPGSLITTRVDVSGYLDTKRKAMAAHASQMSDTSFFLSMPDDAFARTWGTEFYVRRDAPAGTVEDDILAGV
jgi:LmbE family N-acetylglucosaminyl deacetylase